MAFSKLLTKKKEEFRQNHTTIVRDEYKIEDLMNVVRHLCQPGKRILLQDIFEEAKDVNELITVFLATLELIKVQEVEALQEEPFGDIILVGLKNE